MKLATNEPDAPTFVAVAAIRVDGGTQMRADLNKETVAEYVDVIYAQTRILDWPFPPLVVFYDGETYWLADGFHRLAAFRKALRIDSPQDINNSDIAHTLPALVRAGDRRQAILHAAGANAAHGLRRTNADKRRSVETLLRDEEWRAWSDQEIARKCVVDAKTVGNIRRELTSTLEFPESNLRTTTSGRTINTGNIGRVASPQPTPAEMRQQQVIANTPPDLLAAGYKIWLWRVGEPDSGWFWQSSGNATHAELNSRRFDTIERAISDARHMREAMAEPEPAPTIIPLDEVVIDDDPPDGDPTDEELAAMAEVAAEREAEEQERLAIEEAKMESVPVHRMPTEVAADLTLPEIHSVLELAKEAAKRARELDPRLHNPVTNALPTWSQLIVAVEKVLK